MRHIRIVKIPPGDAPKRIRAAWVGITLQLADLKMPQPTVWLTTSVLRKDRGWLARFKRFFGVLIDQPAMVSVYAVDTMGAIDVLRTHSPSAAKWWERNTPHLLKEGKRFCFEASCCEDIAPEVIYSS